MTHMWHLYWCYVLTCFCWAHSAKLHNSPDSTTILAYTSCHVTNEEGSYILSSCVAFIFLNNILTFSRFFFIISEAHFIASIVQSFTSLTSWTLFFLYFSHVDTVSWLILPLVTSWSEKRKLLKWSSHMTIVCPVHTTIHIQERFIEMLSSIHL